MCGAEIPTTIVIDGSTYNLGSRRYCLTCSPRGLHNTRKLERVNQADGGSSGFICLCATCGESDPSLFYVSSQHRTICKRCFNKSCAGRQVVMMDKARRYLGHRCQGCGYDKWAACLQFHHLIPNRKGPNARGMKGWTWRRIVAELSKCVLLCANCHAALHAGEDVFAERCAECVLEGAPGFEPGCVA